MWPVDKLASCNTALALCGDNLCSVVEDGSDEWTVASAAYENAIEYMLEAHDWKGLTAVATLVSDGTTPGDTEFTDSYAKPADAVHVLWVRTSGSPSSYQVLGNKIVLNAGGATDITIKYVSSNNADPANGALTRIFMTALKAFIRAGIYSGLHEDSNAEARWIAVGNQLLAEAKTRSDQEQPKRAMFNSRLAAARRVRRPWATTPSQWGGTGRPGG